MSRHALALAAALCASAPAMGVAFQLSLGGGLDLGYSRIDSGDASGFTGGNNLDFGLHLQLGGSAFQGRLLEWNANGFYRGLRTYYTRERGQADNFGFGVNVGLFQAWPVRVNLIATRAWTQFLDGADTNRTGASLTTTLGGTVTLDQRGYPTLQATANHTRLENHGLGGAESQTDSTRLSLTSAWSNASQSYQADYDASWNSGTFADVNHDTHAVTGRLAAGTNGSLQFRAMGRYFVRLPRNDARTNPRYDDGLAQAGLYFHPSERVDGNLEYGYRQVLLRAPEAPASELGSHTLGSRVFFRQSPSFAIYGTARAAYTEQRVGEGVRRGHSQDAGVGAAWTHDFGRVSLQLGGGGNAGLATPIGGVGVFAWGANATAGLAWALRHGRTQLGYQVGYADGLAAAGVWTFDQRLQLSAEGYYERATVRALLQLVGARREDPVLGSFANRSALLNVDTTVDTRWSFHLAAAANEGFADAMGNIVGDGLLLPIEFNTHSAYGMLSAVQGFMRGRLSISENVRGLVTSTPGRPEQWEVGAGLLAGFTIGAIVLTLEERVSYGGFDRTRQLGNYVMLRASRSFGWNWML